MRCCASGPWHLKQVSDKIGRMSRLKSTGLTAAWGGVTEAVWVVRKSPTKKKRMLTLRSNRVRKLISLDPCFVAIPEETKLYARVKRDSMTIYGATGRGNRGAPIWRETSIR